MADGDLASFLAKYSIDERASRTLEQCTPEVQAKVIATFAPHQQSDSQDYSRKLMGYIRSVSGQDGGRPGGVKRSFAEVEEAAVPVDPVELEAFRVRFPMDDRAFEFLCSSTAGVQARVLRAFNPRSANEADYSSLVTSFVKKVRSETDRGGGGGIGLGPTGLGGGPTRLELEAFRARYPMDDRAWDFLVTASGSAQATVVSDFKPRREDDSDYSAAVTAFLKSVSATKQREGGGARGPSMSQLEAFRQRFPMDDRAFEFLESSSPAAIQDVLRTFNPRNPNDTDYSRPITAFVKQCRERAERNGQAGGGGGGGFGRSDGRPGGYGGGFGGGDRRFGGSDRDRRGDYGRDQGCDWLRCFKKCFPMDAKAWDYLEQSSVEVQEAVVSEFRPRRAGEDDYSAAVTSFVKRVRSRLEAGPPGVRLGERRSRSAPFMLLEAFRQRYPMDDRAWDFFSNSSPNVQRNVMERFKPQREGESDYSRLITSFIRSARD